MDRDASRDLHRAAEILEAQAQILAQSHTYHADCRSWPPESAEAKKDHDDWRALAKRLRRIARASRKRNRA